MYRNSTIIECIDLHWTHIIIEFGCFLSGRTTVSLFTFYVNKIHNWISNKNFNFLDSNGCYVRYSLAKMICVWNKHKTHCMLLYELNKDIGFAMCGNWKHISTLFSWSTSIPEYLWSAAMGARWCCYILLRVHWIEKNGAHVACSANVSSAIWCFIMWTEQYKHVSSVQRVSQINISVSVVVVIYFSLIRQTDAYNNIQNAWSFPHIVYIYLLICNYYAEWSF